MALFPVLTRKRSLVDDALLEVSALADGSLPAHRRPDVERRVAASPVLRTALARQRRAVVALRSATPATPPRLRARLVQQRVQPRPQRRVLGRPALAAGGLTAATLVAGVLLAAFVLMRSSDPTTIEAAALGIKPAQSATAPAPDRERPALLNKREATLPFPNFAGKFGWRATGVRHDNLDGRRATTVFYKSEGRRLAYTIVGGSALEWPDGRAVMRQGTRFVSFTHTGRANVTWLRRGHTCVLSGRGVKREELLKLAGWTGKGAL